MAQALFHPKNGVSAFDHIVELLGCGKRIQYERGETIVEPKTRERALLIIRSGCIMLDTFLPDGQRQVVGFRFPGDILCTAFVCHQPNSHARAVSNVDLTKIQHRSIKTRIASYPGLGRALARAAAHQAERALLQGLFLGRLDRAQRVATFLFELSLRYGRQMVDGVHIHMPMTREDIGDYLGLNVDTISRALSKFRKSGLFEQRNRDEILISDPEGLAALTPLSDTLVDYYGAQQTDLAGLLANATEKWTTQPPWPPATMRPAEQGR